MKNLKDLDLQGTFKVPRSSAAPAAPVAGQMYYDTDDNKYYGYNGTSWVDLGAGGSLAWTKVTKQYTDFTAAATSESINAFSIPAGYILRGVIIKHTTAFAGTGWTAATLEVGVVGTTDKYLQASDVKAAVGDTVIYGGQNFDIPNWGSATDAKLTLKTTGGNVNAGTAGVVEIYYLTEQVKS